MNVNVNREYAMAFAIILQHVDELNIDLTNGMDHAELTQVNDVIGAKNNTISVVTGSSIDTAQLVTDSLIRDFETVSQGDGSIDGMEFLGYMNSYRGGLLGVNLEDGLDATDLLLLNVGIQDEAGEYGPPRDDMGGQIATVYDAAVNFFNGELMTNFFNLDNNPQDGNLDGTELFNLFSTPEEVPIIE